MIRQTGGKGQYGHAVIKIQANERGAGIEVEDKTSNGVIPKEFIQPTLNGIREAIRTGVIANYELIDLRVELIDGSFHDVDSSEQAFKMAGIFALREAVKKAAPILLEPVMKVEVSTPDEYQGDVLGDINRRRGQVTGLSPVRAWRFLTVTFRFRKCSVTRPRCVRSRRDALRSRWSP